jgi:hypothetical protein
MHRHTLGPSANPHRDQQEELPDLLHGASGRLCQHLLGITQAHNINVYWMDYAEFPPRLKLIQGYSRFIQHRAQRQRIFVDFDKIAYEKNNPNSSCHQRVNADSQIYRVAANNSPEIYNGEGSILWNGYDEIFKPKSALALPVRQNGKVVGVIELNGLVENQFSEHLLAPLLRATNLIGSFMYYNLLLHQLSKVNQWVTAADPLLLEDDPQPLKPLAQLLTNVFLCPMVHIWLSTEDTEIYELFGSSLIEFESKLLDYSKEELSEGKLWFRVDSYNTETSFAYSVLDLWKEAQKSKYLPPWGSFCKACFRDEDQKTEFNTQLAATTGIYLYNDFIKQAEHLQSMRSFIFHNLKLKSVVAFPILQK